MSIATFSVVVTSYNYQSYVIDAIESALAQSRVPMQVIVVDDGSTDGSPQLLRQHYGDDERITLLCAENGGQLAAFRLGAAQARGEIVAFLDSDDLWGKDYLEKLGAIYDERSDIDFIFSDFHQFGSAQRRLGYANRAVDCGFTAISTYILARSYGAPTSALSLRAGLARRCVDLPAELQSTWRTCADTCLIHGASIFAARKYYLPTGEVHCRVHASNASRSAFGASWEGIGVDADKQYLFRMRSRALIEYYAQSVHLTAKCIDDTKEEFWSKPCPTWKEANRYAHLMMRRPGVTRLKNLGRAFSIVKRAWRCRDQAAVEGIPPA